MGSLKKIFEDIEKDKEDLKLEIQNLFIKIRTILNEREDELLKEADKNFIKIKSKVLVGFIVIFK